jgi:hypothetical protein
MQGQLDAARQASTSQNILAIVNFLQDHDVRAARQTVRTVLSSKDFAAWDNRERWTASTVCSSYDVLGIMIRHRLVPREPFVQNWGPSIRHCHEVLKDFIAEMRKQSGPQYWGHFDWLYEQVKGGQAENGIT